MKGLIDKPNSGNNKEKYIVPKMLAARILGTAGLFILYIQKQKDAKLAESKVAVAKYKAYMEKHKSK
ncbi:MAG: hypothetical protein RL613_1158 [Fusobacteriota bacterium]|jgi:hypothetical protein